VEKVLEMMVRAVTVNQLGEFSVLLIDDEKKKVLPIMIGVLEANSIAMPMQGVMPPRPLTHDLLKSSIETLGGTIEKIVITDIRENTFYAALHVSKNGDELVIDARPSDAIALALRCTVPILMNPWLVEFTYDMADIEFEE